jgi:4-nitrophenyl phosphatase
MGTGNVVYDLDGVLYLDDGAIEGAGSALEQIDERGYRTLFVTNNATRSQTDQAEKIRNVTGYAASADQVFTSAMAGAALVAGETGAVFVVGEAGLVATLRDASIRVTDDWTEASLVMVGLDRALTYGRLRDAVLAVRAGARLIATNLDPTYPTPDGQWPGGGAIALAIAAAGEVEPEVAGKPHAPMRDLVRAHLQPGPTWVVGDRPETDLAMGKLEGWKTVLVLTGIISDASEVPPEFTPDLVLNSVAELPGRLP